jgi:hypothetical protein
MDTEMQVDDSAPGLLAAWLIRTLEVIEQLVELQRQPLGGKVEEELQDELRWSSQNPAESLGLVVYTRAEKRKQRSAAAARD